MYEIFMELLNSKGEKVVDVCNATGIAQPTFSDWKKGKSRPNADKLLLIAQYFKVSVEFLLTGKDTRCKDKCGKEISTIIAKIKNDSELVKALNIYFDLPAHKRQHVIDIIHMLGDKD